MSAIFSTVQRYIFSIFLSALSAYFILCFSRLQENWSDLVNSSGPLKWIEKWGLTKLILWLWSVCMREREISLFLTDVTPLWLTRGEQVSLCECALGWIFVRCLSLLRLYVCGLFFFSDSSGSHLIWSLTQVTFEFCLLLCVLCFIYFGVCTV